MDRGFLQLGQGISTKLSTNMDQMLSVSTNIAQLVNVGEYVSHSNHMDNMVHHMEQYMEHLFTSSYDWSIVAYTVSAVLSVIVIIMTIVIIITCNYPSPTQMYLNQLRTRKYLVELANAISERKRGGDSRSQRKIGSNMSGNMNGNDISEETTESTPLTIARNISSTNRSKGRNLLSVKDFLKEQLNIILPYELFNQKWIGMNIHYHNLQVQGDWIFPTKDTINIILHEIRSGKSKSEQLTTRNEPRHTTTEQHNESLVDLYDNLPPISSRNGCGECCKTKGYNGVLDVRNIVAILRVHGGGKQDTHLNFHGMEHGIVVIEGIPGLNAKKTDGNKHKIEKVENRLVKELSIGGNAINISDLQQMLWIIGTKKYLIHMLWSDSYYCSSDHSDHPGCSSNPGEQIEEQIEHVGLLMRVPKGRATVQPTTTTSGTSGTINTKSTTTSNGTSNTPILTYNAFNTNSFEIMLSGLHTTRPGDAGVFGLKPVSGGVESNYKDPIIAEVKGNDENSKFGAKSNEDNDENWLKDILAEELADDDNPLDGLDEDEADRMTINVSGTVADRGTIGPNDRGTIAPSDRGIIAPNYGGTIAGQGTLTPNSQASGRSISRATSARSIPPLRMETAASVTSSARAARESIMSNMSNIPPLDPHVLEGGRAPHEHNDSKQQQPGMIPALEYH